MKARGFGAPPTVNWLRRMDREEREGFHCRMTISAVTLLVILHAGDLTRREIVFFALFVQSDSCYATHSTRKPLRWTPVWPTPRRHETG